MSTIMLKLATTFAKDIIAKKISEKIYKKFGSKIKIQINTIQIDDDSDINIHIDADGQMSKTEFERLMERI